MAKYRFDQIAINSTEKKKPVEEDRFTYLGLEHLDSGTLKVTRFGSEVAPIGEKLVMHKGDVLFGKRRAYQKKVAIAPFDGIFSAHGMVLRPKEEVIDKDFFPLFISSDYFLDAAIKISVGSLSPTINWRDLKELEFELPDLETQRKLAEVLWSINDTMEAYKKLIAATDELVKSQFMEQFGDVHENPHGWDVIKFGDACDILNGFAFKSKLYVNEGIRVIRITNVQKGYIEDSDPQFYPLSYENELSKYMLSSGDILLSLTGNVGRVGLLPEEMLPAALNQRVACIRMKHGSPVSKMFLYSMINSDFFEADCIASSQGIAQKNMSTEWLKDYPVIIPPEPMQAAYVAFVRQSDKSKFELEQALSELTATYKRIIAENLG